MKVDYIVWLKNGRCVEGHADEKAIDGLINAWEGTDERIRNIYHLSDDDGTVVVRLSGIDAIAKNHPEEAKVSGF